MWCCVVWYKFTDISEECTDFNSKAKEYAKQVACSSKTLLNVYQTTSHHIPEKSKLTSHSHRSANLVSHILIFHLHLELPNDSYSSEFLTKIVMHSEITCTLNWIITFDLCIIFVSIYSFIDLC
jgi:hypothetical protein